MCQENLCLCFQTATGASLGAERLVPSVCLGLFPEAGAPQGFSKKAAVTHTSCGSMGARNPHPASLSSKASLSTSAFLQNNDVFFFFKNNSGKGKTANTYGITYSCLENSMGRGARQATAHGATRVRHNWVSEQTWHLLIVIKPQASPLTAQVPATAPLSGNTHHKHLHAQRISYNSCMSISLYPFPNANHFRTIQGFKGKVLPFS